MIFHPRLRSVTALICLIAVTACGIVRPAALSPEAEARDIQAEQERSTIWDVFRRQNPDVQVAVNRYIWNASLDVLNFMPIESVDPFSGVIVMGYGTPPGGGSAYRATVYVKDPALEARSLAVALQNRSGRPVSPQTQRAVEDAILSRARQMRIQDGRF